MGGQNNIGYPGWEAGQEISTEEEYEQATEWLANKLLAECTPEHLAVIAAQHMIFVDTLKATQESLTITNDSLKRSCDTAYQLTQAQLGISEELRKERTSFAISMAQLAVTAYKKHSRMPRSEGGKARHRETSALKVEALSNWEETGAKYSSRAAFARQNCRRYSVTKETLQRWIAGYEKVKKHIQLAGYTPS